MIPFISFSWSFLWASYDTFYCYGPLYYNFDGPFYGHFIVHQWPFLWSFLLVSKYIVGKV